MEFKNYMSQLAYSIVCYRLEKGLTQVEFAKLCGVTSQTISNIENDRVRPTKKSFVAINKVLRG